MAQRFEVIGEDDVEGADVMGRDVMGYGGGLPEDVEGHDRGAQVVGYDRNGYPVVVGGRRPAARVNVYQPGWRGRQLAPGVIAPDQGLLTLPMGNFTFSVANGQIFTFQGQVQKPFRGERWLVRVVRTGTSATGTLLSQLFVGTDLAQLDVSQVDLESLANPQAFGVRMAMKPAQPGVFIRAVTALSTPLTSTDTIAVSLQLLGRNIH